MQYSLIDLVSPEHILVDIPALGTRDAIRCLTESLVASGHVTYEFADDVLKREQTFPTGLPTQPLAVAIPHADPDHVNRSAVCVGVMRAPVPFGEMGTDGSTVLDVRVIFLLAIKEREKQVEMIRQLVALIQNPSLLEKLVGAPNSEQVLKLIQEALA